MDLVRRFDIMTPPAGDAPQAGAGATQPAPAGPTTCTTLAMAALALASPHEPTRPRPTPDAPVTRVIPASGAPAEVPADISPLRLDVALGATPAVPAAPQPS